MKRILLAVLFGALLFGLADSRNTVKEIAPGVWVRMGDRDRRQPANSGWVIFRDHVFVIDANFPWGAKEVLAEIRRTTDKPVKYVFNTHYHGDHYFGSSVYTDIGAQIICSAACAEEIVEKGRPGWNRNTETGEFSLKPYTLPDPAITFKAQKTFEDKSHRVDLMLLGPGHSRGDAVAWLPKEKILFSGDLCVNWKFGNNVADADSDVDNWIRALDKMSMLDPKLLVVGHGELGAKPEILAQRAYLTDMVAQVRSGIAAGKSADDLAKSIDLTKHKIGSTPESNANSVKALHKKFVAK